MTKVVGDVVINVGANIGPLVREMGRSEKVLDRLDSAAKSAGRGLQAMGSRATELGKKMSIVSAAIAGVTAGTLALVRNAANVGDRIGNAAKAAGLGAEAFQEYAFAIGEAADITEDEFSASVVILNRKLGEAAEGSASAVAAFERIGISQQQIESGAVTTEQALAAWVKTVEASGSSAEAAALSTDLFGKKGAAMGAMLQGADGQVAGFITRARELGLVVSNEVVAESAVFNDKMAELAKQFELVKMKIAEVLLPVINNQLIPALQDKVIPAVVQVVEKIGEWISWFEQLDPAVQQVVGIITTAFAAGGPALLAIGAVGTAIGAIFTGPAAPLVLLGAAITGAALAWREWGDDVKAAIGGAIDWVSGKFEAFIGLLDGILQKAREVGSAIAEALSLGKTEMNSGTGYGGMAGAGDEFGTGAFGGGAGGAMGGQMMGAAIMNGMVLGATNSLNEKRQALIDLFNQVPQIARETLGIQSPSRVFAEIGQFMGQGMAQGITDSTALVASATQGMTGAATQAANEGVSGVLTAMGGLFEGSKKISAGIALANSWLAFTEVLKDPSFVGRPWARIAAAFAALKPGLQAVKNIQSARPGGTGAGSASAGAASAGASAPQGVANITLVGNQFSGAQVQDLFRQINDGLRMGYRINVVTQ